MKPINAFLLKNNLRIAQNPCVSPDFCLDWPALQADLRAGRGRPYEKSRFRTVAGEWTLLEGPRRDCAWQLHASAQPLDQGTSLDARTMIFPATWANLLKLKNLIQESDPDSTIFPTAGSAHGCTTPGPRPRMP